MNLRNTATALLACAILPASAGTDDGAALFSTNCSACHQLDRMLVGPSLVEISGIYRGKPEDFLKWCVAPAKKRDLAIEMPSMAHLGDASLRSIYAYIMKSTRGVAEKKDKDADPFAASPSQMMRPLVQRIFMPDAGPSAIAVALDEKTSFCWDAGTCRFRYAWTGGFIQGYGYWKGKGDLPAKIVGEKRYVETAPLFGTASQVQFHGYDLKEGFPVFRYALDGMEIEEGYTKLKGSNGFARRFAFSTPRTNPLVMKFPKAKDVRITSDKGVWEGRTLTIPQSDSAVTVTFVFP